MAQIFTAIKVAEAGASGSTAFFAIIVRHERAHCTCG